MDKGTASNVVSATLLGLGLALPSGSAAQGAIVSVGLFALSGGITNTLAVKMLFDRVPGLVGSGVIPSRFREIRAKIKTTILSEFFDPSFLRDFLASRRGAFDATRYVKGKPEERGVVSHFVEKEWDRVAAPEVVEPIVDRQIEKLLDSPVGGMLVMAGLDNVRPAVGQLVRGLATSMRNRILDLAADMDDRVDVELDEDKLLEDLRKNVEQLLEEKLRQLDAPAVKRMLEEVIRRHLGWLIVWGNLLGGLVGLAAFFLRL